ncbi:MAG: outer membrane beta-barrel protein [Thermoguttaceae bacterium]
MEFFGNDTRRFGQLRLFHAIVALLFCLFLFSHLLSSLGSDVVLPKRPVPKRPQQERQQQGTSASKEVNEKEKNDSLYVSDSHLIQLVAWSDEEATTDPTNRVVQAALLKKPESGISLLDEETAKNTEVSTDSGSPRSEHLQEGRTGQGNSENTQNKNSLQVGAEEIAGRTVNGQPTTFAPPNSGNMGNSGSPGNPALAPVYPVQQLGINPMNPYANQAYWTNPTQSPVNMSGDSTINSANPTNSPALPNQVSQTVYNYDPNNPNSAGNSPYFAYANGYGVGHGPYSYPNPPGSNVWPGGASPYANPYGYVGYAANPDPGYSSPQPAQVNPYSQVSPYPQINLYSQVNPYPQINPYSQVNPYTQVNPYAYAGYTGYGEYPGYGVNGGGNPYAGYNPSNPYAAYAGYGPPNPYAGYGPNPYGFLPNPYYPGYYPGYGMPYPEEEEERGSSIGATFMETLSYFNPLSSPTGTDRGVGQPLRMRSWLDRPFYWGVFGGYMTGSDLVKDTVGQKGGGTGGVSFGWYCDDYWGFEARLFFSALPSKDSEAYTAWVASQGGNLIDKAASRTNKITILDVAVHYYPLGNAKWRPYLKFGVGTVNEQFSLYNDKYSLGSISMPIGIGMRYWWNDRIALQGEIADNVIFASGITQTQNNFGFTLGLTFPIGKTKRKDPYLYWPAQPSTRR